MRTILFLLNELDDISFDRMVLIIAASLDQKKFTPYVYSLKKNGKLCEEFEAQLHDHFFTSSGSMLVDAIKIAQFVVKHPKCIIQTPALRSDYVVFLVKAMLLGLVPFYHIAVRHNYLFQNNSLYNFVKNILYFFSCRTVDKNVCVGKFIRKKLTDHIGINPSKIVTIANGVKYFPPNIIESAKNKKALKLKEGIPVIIYIGSFIKRKNLLFLIDALSQIDRDYYCLLFGDGPERKNIEKRIIDRGLRNKIILINFRKNIENYLTFADIFVMPSLDEGLSLSIIEAMQAGLPCAVSDIPGNRELIDEDKEGLIFSPYNRHSCAGVLFRLLKDKVLSGNYGKNARKKANVYYNEKYMLESYNKLYKNAFTINNSLLF